MPLKEQIETELGKIFKNNWRTRDGLVVPDPSDVNLTTNDMVKLNAVVLYADISESTKLVDGATAFFAAEIYKSYLFAAGKIVRSENGAITAYDGDRIMAVFVGAGKEERAVKAALGINGARNQLINPAIQKHYPKSTYQLRHTVGIDVSEVHVARIGVRNANDLVWVGKAANHAAKLCSLPSETPTWITDDVYNAIPNNLKVSGNNQIWGRRRWTAMGDRIVHCSTWQINHA